MPTAAFPSLSTDLVAAFVQLAEVGSLRGAAEALFISEQGLRSRLLALEERLGVELYRKQRGLRRRTPLTSQGQQLLPHARSFLERAGELADLFREGSGPQEVNVVASQYLIAYVLIAAVQRFHAAFPQIHVRLSARTEREIEAALVGSLEYSLGVAAPYRLGLFLPFFVATFGAFQGLHRTCNHAARMGVRITDQGEEVIGNPEEIARLRKEGRSVMFTSFAAAAAATLTVVLLP